MAETLRIDSGWVTASKDHHYFRLYVWETGTNISTNQSTFRFEFYLAAKKNGYDWYHSGTVPVTYSISVGGYSWSGNIMSYDGSSTVKISSGGGYTINHTSTGSQTISASFSVSSISKSYLPGSASFSKSGVALTTIPRQANLTAAPNFTDEGNPTITYSNPAGTVVTSLQACIASTSGSPVYVPYRDISKTGTSYTFNLTDDERETLRKACTTSNSMSVKFYVKTVLAGSTYYSTLTQTLTIVNNMPVFTSDQLSYADTDKAITTVTQNPLMIVQNKSNLKVTYTAAATKKHATISQYSFTLNGVTKTSTAAGGTVDFGKINSDKDLTLTVTAKDSRGNTVSATKTIKCYKYYSPYFIDFKTYRANQNGQIDLGGAYLKCEYTTNIASVDGTNARTISIVGVNPDIVWENGEGMLIDLHSDKDTTYQVYAVVNDLFGGTATSTVNTVFGDSRIINVTPDGTGVAIGKKAEKSESFECRWDAQFNNDVHVKNDLHIQNDVYFGGGMHFENKSLIDFIYPVGSIYMSVNSVSPATLFGGTWESFGTGRTLVGVDASQTEFASVEKTGGAKTHTLTTAQMPSHTHTQNAHSHSVRYKGFTGLSESSGGWLVLRRNESGDSYDGTDGDGAISATATNQNTGGGGAHNNLQPYITVYMWKRTA